MLNSFVKYGIKSFVFKKSLNKLEKSLIILRKEDTQNNFKIKIKLKCKNSVLFNFCFEVVAVFLLLECCLSFVEVCEVQPDSERVCNIFR